MPHLQHPGNFARLPAGYVALPYGNQYAGQESVAALQPDLQYSPFLSGGSYQEQSSGFEWQYSMNTGISNETAQWPASQQNWMHTYPVWFNPQYRQMQTGLNPDLHAAAFSAYPGMPPFSDDTNWQGDD